jgi:hypothetical protein
MLNKSPSPTSSEKHFSEIELGPQEAQDILDRFWKASCVLTARLWSKHQRPSARSRPIPQIKVSGQTNWRDLGHALRIQFLERAGDRCDCCSCRGQHSKRGQRERDWVDAVVFAQMGDPSKLVEHLSSRRAFTQFDRKILSDLLDCYFKGEIRQSWSPVGRPKNIAAQVCANTATVFYKDWKASNRRWGIKDWGHSDEMKDEACRVAIDYHLTRRDREGRVPISNHPMDEVPDFEQVRALMDRPRSRR